MARPSKVESGDPVDDTRGDGISQIGRTDNPDQTQAPDLAKLKRYFTEARDLTYIYRTNALGAIDYYDSDQFTGVELTKLAARGQAAIVINRIKPAITSLFIADPWLPTSGSRTNIKPLCISVRCATSIEGSWSDLTSCYSTIRSRAARPIRTGSRGTIPRPFKPCITPSISCSWARTQDAT
jgi:hypothetical protein